MLEFDRIGFEKKGGILRKRKGRIVFEESVEEGQKEGRNNKLEERRRAEMRTDVCLLCATFSA